MNYSWRTWRKYNFGRYSNFCGAWLEPNEGSSIIWYFIFNVLIYPMSLWIHWKTFICRFRLVWLKFLQENMLYPPKFCSSGFGCIVFPLCLHVKFLIKYVYGENHTQVLLRNQYVDFHDYIKNTPYFLLLSEKSYKKTIFSVIFLLIWIGMKGFPSLIGMKLLIWVCLLHKSSKNYWK